MPVALVQHQDGGTGMEAINTAQQVLEALSSVPSPTLVPVGQAKEGREQASGQSEELPLVALLSPRMMVTREGSSHTTQSNIPSR